MTMSCDCTFILLNLRHRPGCLITYGHVHMRDFARDQQIYLFKVSLSTFPCCATSGALTHFLNMNVRLLKKINLCGALVKKVL